MKEKSLKLSSNKNEKQDKLKDKKQELSLYNFETS